MAYTLISTLKCNIKIIYIDLLDIFKSKG